MNLWKKVNLRMGGGERTYILHSEPSKKMRTGIEYSKMNEISLGMFKRPKVWNSTRMVVYEFEMVERFLENSIDLDIPTKYLLVAKCHCLAMFALKIVLKNVQKVDVSCDYIDNVIVKERGMQAMLLATRVAQDMFTGIKPDFLCTDEQVMENTNIRHEKSPVFSKELFQYLENKKELFSCT